MKVSFNRLAGGRMILAHVVVIVLLIVSALTNAYGQVDMSVDVCDQDGSTDLAMGNCSFELWGISAPINWKTANPYGVFPVSKSFDYHPSDDITSEAHSVKLSVTWGSGQKYTPVLYSVKQGLGHRIDKAYPTFRGFYKDSLFAVEDSLMIHLDVADAQLQAVGHGLLRVRTDYPPGTRAAWKEFVVPIEYTGLTPGESAMLYVTATFSIAGPVGGASIGSWVLIDDVCISSDVSVGMDRPTEVPGAFALRQNYPNPFNPATTIAYDLATSAEVNLEVYDILGRRVDLLASGIRAAGTYEVTFDATALPSGMYVYRLQASDFIAARRLVVLR